jgi:hypothetical protein
VDAAIPDETAPAAYRDPAKGAAYRQKAMPDLPSASRRGSQGDRVFKHRVTFSKTGDARFLSHRNTMDVLERAIRAAGLPARYSEGFNPHMRLSMGPALALGLESLHEVFDVDGNAPFPTDAAERTLAKAVKGARYSVRLATEEQIARAGEVLANGAGDAMPAVRAFALEADRDGTSLRFEVNLDQSSGETSTPKKVLETLLAIPPAEQLSLSVTREATLLG